MFFLLPPTKLLKRDKWPEEDVFRKCMHISAASQTAVNFAEQFQTHIGD